MRLSHLMQEIWHGLTHDVPKPYRPEQHYMRGPGPAWRAKHGLASDTQTNGGVFPRCTGTLSVSGKASPDSLPQART